MIMPLTPELMREKIKAVVVVQATPLNHDGSLDLAGLKANTQFLVERCAGKRIVLVPTGSTGEAYALLDAERIKVIETVVNAAAGRLPVVAGTAAAGTECTIEISKAAESVGADGLQVVLPYYHVPSGDGLVRHYLRLADAVKIGVMIYNNPIVSKLWMPPHLMARCAQHPNIVADKENTSDVSLYKAMRDAVEPYKMPVLCGLGEIPFAYSAALGCPGFVTWTANFAPELALQLLDAADVYDFRRVRELIDNISPLYAFVEACAHRHGPDPWVFPGFASPHIYVGVLKAIMEILGLAGGAVRGPSDDITPEERVELKAVLKRIGVLEENRSAA
jgi:4-hydroxy-tetrahydrodipicolinate synthase